MPVVNRLIHIDLPTNDAAVANCREILNVPFPVKKLKVKQLAFRSQKPVSNQDLDYLTLFSQIVPGKGPLGFCHDDVTTGTISYPDLTYEFDHPQTYNGFYQFQLFKSDGVVYTTNTSNNVIKLIVEFSS